MITLARWFFTLTGSRMSKICSRLTHLLTQAWSKSEAVNIWTAPMTRSSLRLIVVTGRARLMWIMTIWETLTLATSPRLRTITPNGEAKQTNWLKRKTPAAKASGKMPAKEKNLRIWRLMKIRMETSSVGRVTRNSNHTIIYLMVVLLPIK